MIVFSKIGIVFGNCTANQHQAVFLRKQVCCRRKWIGTFFGFEKGWDVRKARLPFGRVAHAGIRKCRIIVHVFRHIS